MKFSTTPDGERFPLPKPENDRAEYKRVKALADEKRRAGHEIVVVMGLGFVGAVMAAVVADSVDRKTRKPRKLVIGVQRPSVRSYWKVPVLNRGVPPVSAEDPAVPAMIARTVKRKKTLVATHTEEALKLADVVVVDVQCDYVKESLGDISTGWADMEAFKAAIATIGRKIPAGALVLVETTVAPGTTEHVAFPILQREFRRRKITSEPLLAHSFERVMPGRDYVASIRDFWRVCAGCTPAARKRAAKFLHEVLDTRKFPLTVLDRPIESETTKIMENAWRATILAYMAEWGIFCERAGVDMAKVVQAIKVRPTHSNILFPGPGIGGYCLPKDGALGIWAATNILGFKDADKVFQFTGRAININDTRALHAADLLEEALAELGRKVRGAKVLLLGAAYRQDVGDTRYSPSELIVRRLAELGADVRVHDPYLEQWWELEQQDTQGHSWKRYFRNQAKLKALRLEPDLARALKGVHAVIFAARHAPYLKLSPQRVVRDAGRRLAVVDCFAVLPDAKIKAYLGLGCAVRAMGRGHIAHLKKKN